MIWYLEFRLLFQPLFPAPLACLRIRPKIILSILGIFAPNCSSSFIGYIPFKGQISTQRGSLLLALLERRSFSRGQAQMCTFLDSTWSVKCAQVGFLCTDILLNFAQNCSAHSSEVALVPVSISRLAPLLSVTLAIHKNRKCHKMSKDYFWT